MTQEISLAVAFTLGLFSTVHCLGMCGGIVGALMLGLAPEVRRDRRRLLLMTAGYNLGRVATYALAGLLIGGFFGVAVRWAMPQWGHTVLATMAATAIIATGLYLMGLPARINTMFRYLESLGMAVWRRIQPVVRRLLPVRTVFHALALGGLWGFLPCGLVYMALVWAAGAGNALLSAAVMAAFGLGTLPGMLAAGYFAGAAMTPIAGRKARLAAGVILTIVGVATAALALQPQDHAGHASPAGHAQHHH